MKKRIAASAVVLLLMLTAGIVSIPTSQARDLEKGHIYVDAETIDEEGYDAYCFCQEVAHNCDVCQVDPW